MHLFVFIRYKVDERQVIRIFVSVASFSLLFYMLLTAHRIPLSAIGSVSTTVIDVRRFGEKRRIPFRDARSTGPDIHNYC